MVSILHLKYLGVDFGPILGGSFSSAAILHKREARSAAISQVRNKWLKLVEEADAKDIKRTLKSTRIEKS